MRMSAQKATWQHALAAACALVCLLAFAVLPVHATQKEIPDFCKPILEAWGANNAKELMEAVLKDRDNRTNGSTCTKGQKPLLSSSWAAPRRNCSKTIKNGTLPSSPPER